VSVTSAVGGIAVAKPQVLNDITPISLVSFDYCGRSSCTTLIHNYSTQAFLVTLFLVQRFGTARITAVFAPVTFLWLTLLAATGIYNISKHPGVFRAFDPSRAVACKYW
jgi:KUP system potassium uptake protein